jgi:hypothetical protein
MESFRGREKKRSEKEINCRRKKLRLYKTLFIRSYRNLSKA